MLRLGLPTKMDKDSTTVTLVNVSATVARTVVLQGGAYGEHKLLSIAVDGGTPTPVSANDGLPDSAVAITLAPGCAGTLTIAMVRRRASRPKAPCPFLCLSRTRARALHTHTHTHTHRERERESERE